jgi:hypothetical protein
MLIKENSNEYPLPFGVSAEYKNRLGDMSLERITLMIQGTLVELNKEECQELVNVINGRKCNTICFREEHDYMPHEIVYNSKPTDSPEGVLDVTRN